MELAARGQIREAIGRDDEIKRVLQILSLYTKNNPVLVGEPGTKFRKNTRNYICISWILPQSKMMTFSDRL